MTDVVLVSAATHPTLFEAFETISHDSGGSAGWPHYRIPARYEASLAAFERALSTLTSTELETFCIGETREAAQLSVLQGLREVDVFLNDFFDSDWSQTVYPTEDVANG